MSIASPGSSRFDGLGSPELSEPFSTILEEIAGELELRPLLTSIITRACGLLGADEGAIGLCTTHDLALAEAIADLGPRACNVHFADDVVEGRLVFDYRMRPGIVRRSNAIALMRAIGLLEPHDQG